MLLERRSIIACALNLAYILAGAVLNIGKPKGGLVVKIGHLRQKGHVRIAVCSQPADRKMSPGSGNHFIVIDRIIVYAPDNGRNFLTALCDDSVNQVAHILFIQALLNSGITLPYAHAGGIKTELRNLTDIAGGNTGQCRLAAQKRHAAASR